MKKTFIWTSFSKAGIHQYSAVTTRPELQDQDYLQHPHRHLFKFRVAIEVFHEDRDLEFINFQEWMLTLYSGSTLTLNNQSCEMISDALAAQIHLKYPNRELRIEVSEDGESGSYIEYD